jgi:hypothetical protein
MEIIKQLTQEVNSRYPNGRGCIGSQHDAFIEGAMWVIEKVKDLK